MATRPVVRWRWNARAAWQLAFAWHGTGRVLIGVHFAGRRFCRSLAPANDVLAWGCGE